MAANLRRVLVVDIECTCWETREEQGERPNEVIEIGICQFNTQTDVIDDISSYIVKPRFTTVSPFCTQLTGWTQEAIDGGADIADTLIDIMRDYEITREDVWVSSGEYDRAKLVGPGRGSVEGLYGIQRHLNPFALMRSHLNVKTLFALKHRRKKETGLHGMLSHYNLKFEGQPHNGADDAFNLARVLRQVLT